MCVQSCVGKTICLLMMCVVPLIGACKDSEPNASTAVPVGQNDVSTQTAAATVAAPSKIEPSNGELFLNALEKNDIPALIRLSAPHQQKLAQLRESNPRELWPKVESEYYDSQKEFYFSGPVFLESAHTYPQLGIDLLRTIMKPAGHQRRLIGRRRGHIDVWQTRLMPEDCWIESFEIVYSSPEHAPFGQAGSNKPEDKRLGEGWYPLRRTEVDLVLSTDNKLYINCRWAGFGKSNVFVDESAGQ